MAKNVKTEKEFYDLIDADSPYLRIQHRHSAQQGSDFAYTALHNELEWQVFEGKISRDLANEILTNLEPDVTAKRLSVSQEVADRAVTPLALTEATRKRQNALRLVNSN